MDTRIWAGCLTALLLMGVAHSQPLFDYANRRDDSYAWEKVSETTLPGGMIWTELKMTSQTWQGIPWVHQVAIVRPAQMTSSETAVLLINGGKLRPQEMAIATPIINGIGAPLVYLGDIPNQPLFGDLREDALIAYTFQKALETRDMTWPLLFPMAKSALRAMDCVQEYTAQAWEQPVKSFVVTGASKRGWTTWFTGVLDGGKRVKGIAPLVYDNLNLPAQMAFQLASYGQYSSQIDDYTQLGLPDLLQSARGRVFGAAVDPYTYRHRVTMPKLIVNGSNDPYWVVDSTNLYWNDLTGPKYVLYVPNAGHGLGDLMRVLNAEVGFFLCCTGRAAFPELDWCYEEGRHLRLSLTGQPAPRRVNEWTATAPTRDFRQSTWVCREVPARQGVYSLRQRYPAAGYAAVFGEALFDVGGREFPLSTTIRVLKAR
ncbi:MAG: phenylacetic acid degradation protein [Armatimonadetes bacterium]|nr:phenylacetic acid degradation protein [Armatimonadota bacterium]